MDLRDLADLEGLNRGHSMAEKNRKSLKTIVGPETYGVWVDMLRRLVPEGRTHRLAPMIAGMLQYAYAIASEGDGDEAEEGSAASILLECEDIVDSEDAPELLDLVVQLFKDSKVKYKRANSQGEGYSIAESAVIEFIHWLDMPWES
jgi:ribosomal protein L13E